MIKVLDNCVLLNNSDGRLKDDIAIVLTAYGQHYRKTHTASQTMRELRLILQFAILHTFGEEGRGDE